MTNDDKGLKSQAKSELDWARDKIKLLKADVVTLRIKLDEATKKNTPLKDAFKAQTKFNQQWVEKTEAKVETLRTAGLDALQWMKEHKAKTGIGTVYDDLYIAIKERNDIDTGKDSPTPRTAEHCVVTWGDGPDHEPCPSLAVGTATSTDNPDSPLSKFRVCQHHADYVLSKVPTMWTYAIDAGEELND